MKNEMHLEFSALSQNESFARVTVASFIAQLDPTMDELTSVFPFGITYSKMHDNYKIKNECAGKG